MHLNKLFFEFEKYRLLNVLFDDMSAMWLRLSIDALNNYDSEQKRYNQLVEKRILDRMASIYDEKINIAKDYYKNTNDVTNTSTNRDLLEKFENVMEMYYD